MIGIAASTITLVWTSHYDRYKRGLEEREKCLGLMSALLDEIQHLKLGINEALQKVNEVS